MVPLEAGPVRAARCAFQRAELVLREADFVRRRLLPLPELCDGALRLEDEAEPCRTRPTSSSGKSAARDFASFTTPLAWRVNDPLVANA